MTTHTSALVKPGPTSFLPVGHRRSMSCRGLFRCPPKIVDIMKCTSSASLLASFWLTVTRLSGQEITTVEIDCQQRGSSISPLLFGHNLEVTRRDIWQGLGAEMVANRKFAARQNGQPKRWTVTGTAAKLGLDAQVTYNGWPSAKLEISPGSGGGLWQREESLDFSKGRRYAFRCWLKSRERRTVRTRVSDGDGRATLFQAEKVLKPGDWQLWRGNFSAATTGQNARLEISSSTAGTFWVGAASVQPADNFHGMRRDVIARLKQIKPGALRFPGGCYAEFYRWQDGLLPVDQRPPIGPTGLDFLLRDSDEVDAQELGIDEFIALCREVGCEAALTVRLSETSAEDGAAWVEYCNGSADTKWGRVRAERGHREPYRVKTWLLGNELYFFGRGGMKDAGNCARQTKAFAEAIRKVDPSVKLVGCTYKPEWNRPLLAQAGNLLDYASFHDYLLDSLKPSGLEAMAKAPTLHLRPLLKNFHEALRRPIVFDEWNTRWGNAGSVGMGLYAAGVLNLLAREAEPLGVEQAYFFQPITEGAIRVTPREASMDAAGEVFNLLKVHQGNCRLKTPALPAEADLDLCASLTPDQQRAYFSIINRSLAHAQAVELTLRNFSGTAKATVKFLIPRALDASAREFREVSQDLRVGAGQKINLQIPPSAIACVRFGKPARLE
jgi:alpha-L-arabinofuranosidase